MPFDSAQGVLSVSRRTRVTKATKTGARQGRTRNAVSVSWPPADTLIT